jgi:hypothetical protein
MKFLKFFLLLWVIFALLDPDPDSKSEFGSNDLIEYGSGSETLHFDGTAKIALLYRVRAVLSPVL